MGTLILTLDEFIPVVRINCLAHSRHSINMTEVENRVKSIGSARLGWNPLGSNVALGKHLSLLSLSLLFWKSRMVIRSAPL